MSRKHRDVQRVLLCQPQDRAGDLGAEVRGGEDDADAVGELTVLVGFSVRPLLQRLARDVVVHVVLVGVNAHELVPGHRGHHRGVSEGLEIHVPAVGRPLQLDDDQLPCPIHGEKVNPSL
jgi:hypothetical protein